MRWLILLLFLANITVFLGRDTFFNSILHDDAKTANHAGGPKIYLLNETEKEVVAVEKPQAKKLIRENASLINQDKSQLCWYIGVAMEDYGQDLSNEKQTLQKLQQRLEVVGVVSQMGLMSLVTKDQFVVVLSSDESDLATGNKKESEILLRSLLAKGINAFLFKRGELAGDIALGLFQSRSESEQAITDFKKVIDTGKLNLQVQPYKEYGNRLKLALTDAEHSKLSAKLWGKLRVELPGIFKEKKFCQSIAPLAQLE